MPLHIFQQCSYPVVFKAAGDIPVTFVNGKLITVVTVESVPGAEPHKTFAVLENAEYRVLRKTVLDGKMLESLSLFSMEKEIKQSISELNIVSSRMPFFIPASSRILIENFFIFLKLILELIKVPSKSFFLLSIVF